MAKWKRYALFGHPVGHSVSPLMFSAAFGAIGERDLYTAVDLPTEADLRQAVEHLRSGAISGANVTLPHKQTVMSLVDAVAASAAEVGAANLLTVGADGRVTAHNTDVDALTAEIAALWGDQPRYRAAVVGGGGAALAAIAACRRLGFKLVCATSRSWATSEGMYESPSAERARALGVLTTLWPGDGEVAAERSKASQVLRLQWADLAADATLVIQATSAGMLGAASGDEVAAVIPWDRLPANAIAYDVVYNPPLTPFLEAARRNGFRAEGGLGMLVRQAELAIKMWTGHEAPSDVMRQAAEDGLAARDTEA